MGKNIIVVILAFVCPVFAYCMNTNSIDLHNESREEKIKRIDLVEKRLVANGKVTPVWEETNPLNAVWKGCNWVMENVNSVQGWSLTGYSWTRLTKNMKQYRIKVGIINPELTSEADYFKREYYEPHQSRIDWSNDLYDDAKRNCVVGVFFTFKF